MGTGAEILLFTSLAASAAGTGVAVYGQRQQAKAAEATAKYNAQIQSNQALHERQVASENARRATAEMRRQLATVRAATAGRGLAMTGTPLAILGDTATRLELEVLDLTSQADSRARALISRADMSLWEGRRQAGALRTSSIGSGFAGVASATSDYLSASGRIS